MINNEINSHKYKFRLTIINYAQGINKESLDKIPKYIFLQNK